MAIDRRTTLRLLAGGVAGSLLPASFGAGTTAPSAPLYLSARADAAGAYRVSGFSTDGARVFDLPLPESAQRSIMWDNCARLYDIR